MQGLLIRNIIYCTSILAMTPLPSLCLHVGFFVFLAFPGNIHFNTSVHIKEDNISPCPTLPLPMPNDTILLFLLLVSHWLTRVTLYTRVSKHFWCCCFSWPITISHLKIPFSSSREAEIAYNSLRVDKGPKRGGVQKTLSVTGNLLNV